MTLIEVLIAAVLLLVIALGVIPLFLRSMAANVSGEQYTQMANYARTRAEELLQVPFNSTLMTITGNENGDIDCDDNFIQEYYSRADEEWEPGPPPGDGSDAVWIRETTVRQLNIINMMEQDPPDLTDCSTVVLPAGSPEATVQLKEITVEIRNPQTSALRTQDEFIMRVYKSQ